MRDNLPDIDDDHLYTIESHIHEIINENNLCLKSMMKNQTCTTHSSSSMSRKDSESTTESDLEVDEVPSDSESAPNTSGYSSKVKPKKLRCVKV